MVINPVNEGDSSPLSGVRVLNTRPDAQAEKWDQCLRQSGATTLRAALIQIEPITEQDTEAWKTIGFRMQSLSSYQHLIFVSQNAVRHAEPWLQRYWPAGPGPHLHAVGGATAKAIKALKVIEARGLEVAEPGGSMNSEALLAQPTLQALAGQRVMILRGQGGRTLLGDTLQQRGAKVDYCELYRRCFPQGVVSELLKGRWGRSTDVVAVHSGEGLLNWDRVIAELGQGDWRNLPVLLPGERVARLAREKDFNTLLVAESAADQTMLEQLLVWRQQQTCG
ncbi:uroporphyrinogen-III synthase [Pseudomaricurvus alkylphenolicus]|jgi:uroporphyrinogen-III synthase|uniref:uroporphyrinogen-III synthase n=1 Tax=Pseudomaricurvus alkylphenolicus TaxID=1306991 RepID=UPI00141FCC78|nr:uroporphyrinogen-III synthase [Pseudomaricurvus alkylphenolicus]NIB39403.1 uroporphyrinogen-III synthase [Pseudomaricurvus alkylphenolicus]